MNDPQIEMELFVKESVKGFTNIIAVNNPIKTIGLVISSYIVKSGIKVKFGNAAINAKRTVHPAMIFAVTLNFSFKDSISQKYMANIIAIY